MSENNNTPETTEDRRPANQPVGEHPADNVAPPSNPETEQEAVSKGEEKLDRLSTH